jgi:hypothetical protein
MKRILLAKEWAGMRPFAWLLLVMLGLDLLDLGTSNLADLHYKQTLFDPSTWIEDAILPLLLAFAMGSGLLAREVEDGTLAFLDGLPVRRRDVFLAKLAVAGACLFAYAVSAPLLGWTVHHLLRNSVTEPVGAAALGWLAVRYMLLVGAGLALGLLFGFVRYLAWALLAIAAAAVVVLKRSAPRIGSALDPTQLIAEGWSTHGLGSDTVWTIAVLALACTALAWLLFAHAGGAGMQRLARLAQRRSVALILGGAGLVAVPVAFHHALAPDTETEGRHGDDDAATAAAGFPPAPAPAPVPAAPPAARARARKFVTAHYTFNVPAGRAVADADLAAADAAYATAAHALAIAPPDAPRIDVDLSGSIAHTAGLAAHSRIRIMLAPDWHDTLVHETVHVMAGWIAGGEHGRGLERMSLFNEGLAHWAEPGYRQAADVRAREHLALATLFRRRLLDQNALLDNRTLERRLDWRLQYPLGAALVEALVARYGADAPRRVLATLAQADFPPALDGYELYRSAFQKAGFDLNLVLNDYALQLARWSRAFAPVIDAMPRPRGLLVRAAGKVGIAVQLDHPLAAGTRVTVQFRPRIDSGIDDVVAVERFEHYGGRPVAWLPLAQVAGNQVCYQLEVRSQSYGMAEPWSCLPLRAAVPAP